MSRLRVCLFVFHAHPYKNRMREWEHQLRRTKRWLRWGFQYVYSFSACIKSWAWCRKPYQWLLTKQQPEWLNVIHRHSSLTVKCLIIKTVNLNTVDHQYEVHESLSYLPVFMYNKSSVPFWGSCTFFAILNLCYFTFWRQLLYLLHVCSKLRPPPRPNNPLPHKNEASEKW